MNNYLGAIVLGVIEGLTEFIPVSSTGHLILVTQVMSLSVGSSTATFNIAIQLGAILAVLVLYRRRFCDLIKPKNWGSPLQIKILIAIFPALTLGFFLHKMIKEVLFTSETVIFALIIGGILMILVDVMMSQKKLKTTSLDRISYFQALGVGFAQCFALWPGMSRSGSTIVGGLLGKMDYKVAAEFSFLIAVPVMIAAVVYDLIKTLPFLTLNDFLLIGVGFLVSFVVAMLAIVSFLKLLIRFRLIPFGVYRIIIGILYWIVF